MKLDMFNKRINRFDIMTVNLIELTILDRHKIQIIWFRKKKIRPDVTLQIYI